MQRLALLSDVMRQWGTAALKLYLVTPLSQILVIELQVYLCGVDVPGSKREVQYLD
jgi:hypothetical protein